MAGAVQVVEDQSYVTLATNDTYALGALVLGNSLRRVNTNRRLTVMITGGVTQPVRQQLSSVFDVVTEVNVLDSRDTANLALLTRPDLGVTFTKFHCWRLTQFNKCVFLDADTLVLQNVDELFDREEISAAPDAGWPDCFNSGVFVYTPSEETYNALLQFAVSQGSFDGGDQGLLNMYFRDWSTKDIAKHLPFIYNVVSQAFYSYLPAFRYYEKNVKIAHFIGATKPWHHAYNTTTNTVDMKGDAGHHAQFLQLWWQIFMTQVKPGLDPALLQTLNVWECISVDSHSYHREHSELFHHDLHHHHHHHFHLHHHHHHWKTPNEPPPSYQMTSPYEPPALEQVFYEPTVSHTEQVAVENKDDRQYSFFESFYVEPPMSPSKTYQADHEAYSAKEITNQWESYTKEETVTSENIDHNSAGDDKDMTGQQGSERCGVVDIDVVEGKIIGGHNNGSSQHEPVDIDNKTMNDHNSTNDNHQGEKMEIEGGLAQLKLIGDGRDAHQSAKKPDSPARQFSWERGQIDYMGVDSFANIQMKLEESLNNKNKKAEATGEKVATKTTKPAPVPASASPTPPVMSAQKPLKSALKKT